MMEEKARRFRKAVFGW